MIDQIPEYINLPFTYKSMVVNTKYVNSRNGFGQEAKTLNLDHINLYQISLKDKLIFDF
jgi:hypothetical protein